MNLHERCVNRTTDYAKHWCLQYVLPFLSNFFERVFLDQIKDFLNFKKILHDYESDFTKNHSTDSCLSFLNAKTLRSFNDALMTGMILVELHKAFGTINHDILLRKLSIIGFPHHTVK